MSSAKTQAVAFNKSKSNFGLKGWGVILFSFICILFQSSIINDSLNVTIAAFSESRGWDINMLYMFSTIAALIAVVGAAFWGFVSHKFSVRAAWSLSLALTSVACFVWGHASTPIMYFICLAAASVGGMGFCYIANLNVISNWFPRKKGLAMGWVTIGFPVSASISVPLVLGLVGSGGLERVYTFYGIVTAVLFIICLVFIRDYPEQAGAFPDNDRSFSSEEVKRQLEQGLLYMKTSPWTVGKLFKTKQVYLIAFSLGIMELLSLGIMTNFMPRCLQAGYEQSEIVIMLMAAGGIACFGSYACGYLDSKVGPKKAIIITFIAGIVAIILNLIPTHATMYLSLPFLGFMLGGAANYLVSIINTIWGRYDFPMAFKVLKPMVAMLGALGVALVGIIGHTASYAVAYGVLAVLAIIATIVIVTVNDSLIGKDI